MISKKTNFGFEVFKAYFILSLFFLYFLATLLIAFAALVLSIVELVPVIKVSVGVAIVILVFVVVPVDWLVYIATIRPIVHLLKEQKEKLGTEFTSAEAPALFEVIRNVAEQVGCKTPKHVYISNDTNASASFDATIVSIFYPTPKNLTIGADLFTGMNISELKSILAHEFGHFSQKTMHVGSCAMAAEYLCNEYMDVIVSQRTGNVVYYVFLCVNWYLLKLLSKGIHATFRSLARRMEFDADEIAASVAGTNVYVSAFCKVSALTYQYEQFNRVLATLSDEGIQVYNRQECHNIWWKQFPHNSAFDVTPSVLMTKKPHINKGYITIIDKDDTHPTDESRIDNIISMHYPDKQVDYTPSIAVFPAIIWDKQKSANLETRDWQYYDNAQFAAYNEHLAKNYCKGDLGELINRKISGFDIDAIVPTIGISLPKSGKDKRIIADYKAACCDEETCRYLEKGLLSYSVLFYKGEKVKSVSLLRNALQEDISSLTDEVIRIDEQIATYLLANCANDAEQNKVRTLYKDIFQFQDIQSELFALGLQIRVKINEDTFVDRGSGDVEIDLHQEENHFKTLLGNIDADWLKQYVDARRADWLLDCRKKSYNMLTFTDWHKIETFLSVIDYWAMDVLSEGALECKMELCEIRDGFSLNIVQVGGD